MGLRLSSGAGGVGGGVRGAVEEEEGWPGSAVIPATLEPTFMRGPESSEMGGTQHRAQGGLEKGGPG